MGDLDASSSCQVAVVVELLFQFKDLVARVGSPLSLWLHSRLIRSVGCGWKEEEEKGHGLVKGVINLSKRLSLQSDDQLITPFPVAVVEMKT